MLDTDPFFRSVRVREGYPPLEDLGLIGDGETVALVGLDGSIYWLCLPSTPTLSPTQGCSAKANILCAASPPSPAKPRLIMLTAQISR
jgi:hypothetical protein